jgi:arginine/lysine/ornithine decarboxylase
MEVPPRTKRTIVTKRIMLTIPFTGTKLLVLGVLPCEQNFNQNNLLAKVAPELFKENTEAKRRVSKNQLVVHMDNSMCHNGRKIR